MALTKTQINYFINRLDLIETTKTREINQKYKDKENLLTPEQMLSALRDGKFTVNPKLVSTYDVIRRYLTFNDDALFDAESCEKEKEALRIKVETLKDQVMFIDAPDVLLKALEELQNFVV